MKTEMKLFIFSDLWNCAPNLQGKIKRKSSRSKIRESPDVETNKRCGIEVDKDYKRARYNKANDDSKGLHLRILRTVSIEYGQKVDELTTNYIKVSLHRLLTFFLPHYHWKKSWKVIQKL